MTWKLKQPVVPRVPTFLPRHSARWAWQASSMTGSLCLPAIARIASRSATLPPRCTGMIAAVRSVMAASILRGVDLERLRVGVDEDRQGVLEQDGVDRGDEGVGRDDHLVARLDADRRQRGDRARRCRWRWPRSASRRSGSA